MEKSEIKKGDKRTSKPLYLPILILLTLMYLFVESAFNARLLDIVGGKATIEEINHIEFYGRIISGVAVALAVCGSTLFPFIFKRRGGFLDYTGITLISSIFLILLVFHSEKLLIDSLADSSTAQERKNAILLSLASAQIKQGNVLVKGIQLDTAEALSPEGKSFVALFSPLIASMPKGYTLIEREMDSIIRQAISQQLGSAETFYYGAFATSFTPLQELFTSYGEAVERYRKNLLQAHNDADRHWNQYVAKLKKKRLTPTSVPRRYARSVRQNVRDSGIPVSNTWNPSDRKGFTQAYIQAVNEELVRTAKRHLKKYDLPDNFPLTLTSFNAFLTHPAIQKKWKAALHMPSNAVLHNGMTLKEFTSHAFTPLSNALFVEKKNLLSAPVEQFSDKARWEQEGKDAVRSIIVPPIALLFSLLGSIVHVCKVSFYIMRLFIQKSYYALITNAVLFGFLLTLPFFYENAITKTEPYAHVESEIAEVAPITAKTMRWIIQTQSFIYPINNWIHRNMTSCSLLNITKREKASYHE